MTEDISKLISHSKYSAISIDDPLYESPDYTDDTEPNSISEYPNGHRNSAISLPSPRAGHGELYLQNTRHGSLGNEFERPRTIYRNSISINNPPNIDRRMSSLLSLNQLSKRMDSLRHMRPKKLIGNVKKIHDWRKSYIAASDLSKIKNSALRSYYENQNELIERYDSIDKLLDSGIHISMIQGYDASYLEDGNGRLTNRAPANVDLEGGNFFGYNSDEDEAIVTVAIRVNFVVNILLLIGKFVVVYLTKSMSIIASLVDSVLDLLSTLIIFYSNKYASSRSDEFPIGRKRLGPLGVLVFSVVIIISFLQVFQQSLSELVYGAHEVVQLSMVATGIMSLTIAVKLLCFVWCKNVKNSSVQALAEDAKTDVVFNFFSIVFPFIGALVQLWWADSFGASLLCLYVIVQWSLIALEHINNLTGANASIEDYQEILYLILQFSENVAKVKNFRTYHVGDLINVEVDIVIVNEDLSLKDCHDLGESLQYAIETLPCVERCFVHLDYKVWNFMGHLT